MEAPAKLLSLSELDRKLANVIRYGAIHDVDHARALARVAWAAGEGGIPVLTGWLPFVTVMAGSDRDWRPPSPGEQVILLAPSGELASAAILAGVYTGDFPAPDASPHKHVTLYRDEARIEYDAEEHKLSAVLPEGGKASLAAPGGLSIEGDTEAAGDLTVNGNVTVNGDLSATGTLDVSGDATVTGSLTAQGGVSDAQGSMSEMRGTFNVHTHGVPPAVTVPPPNQRMT